MGNEKEYSKEELDEIIQLKKEIFKLGKQSFLTDPTDLISCLSKYSDIFEEDIKYLKRYKEGFGYFE